MKLVGVTESLAGNKLAKAVYSQNGTIMLEAGTLLTERYIQRLKNLKVREVFIEDAADGFAAAKSAAKQSKAADPRAESGRGNDMSGKERAAIHRHLISLLDSSEYVQRSLNPYLCEKYKEAYREIMQVVAGNAFILESLIQMRRKDPHLFNHTLNVAVLSGMIGMSRNYNFRQLMELTIGALLFDYGMLLVPDSLIRKNRSLTQEEKLTIENHTRSGYSELLGSGGIPESAALCALQHHERYNGTGYPNKLKHGEIHEYAQIVAISDVYDALISPRYHRLQYNPSEAAEYLLASGNYYFDLDLVKCFFNTIAIYPVSSKVLLNTGQVGVVKHIHSNLGQRPLISIIKEADGTPADWPYEIDLQTKTNLVITQSL